MVCAFLFGQTLALLCKVVLCCDATSAVANLEYVAFSKHKFCGVLGVLRMLHLSLACHSCKDLFQRRQTQLHICDAELQLVLLQPKVPLGFSGLLLVWHQALGFVKASKAGLCTGGNTVQALSSCKV